MLLQNNATLSSSIIFNCHNYEYNLTKDFQTDDRGSESSLVSAIDIRTPQSDNIFLSN